MLRITNPWSSSFRKLTRVNMGMQMLTPICETMFAFLIASDFIFSLGYACYVTMSGTLGQLTLSQSCSDLATCKNDCNVATQSNLSCWAVNCDTSSCIMIFSSSANRLQHTDNLIVSSAWSLYIRQDPCLTSDCYDAALLGQIKVTVDHFHFSVSSGKCESKCDSQLHQSMPCWGMNIINDECTLLFVSDPDFYTYSINMAVDPSATLKIRKTSGCVPDTTSTTLTILTDTTSIGTSTEHAETSSTTADNTSTTLTILTDTTSIGTSTEHAETSSTTDQTTKSLPDSTTTQYCACSCQLANLLNQQSRYYNMTDEEKGVFLEEQIRQIKEELTVETSNLSATIRKKTSASDSRTSARVMGFTLGVCLICLVIGCIIAMDLPNLIDCVKKIVHRLYSSGDS